MLVIACNLYTVPIVKSTYPQSLLLFSPEGFSIFIFQFLRRRPISIIGYALRIFRLHFRPYVFHLVLDSRRAKHYAPNLVYSSVTEPSQLYAVNPHKMMGE